MKGFLLLSFIIHSFLVVGWKVVLQLQPKQPPKKDLAWVEIEKADQKKPKEEPKRDRIVQTESGEKVKTPVPNSFLGWQNQVVDRETVSKRKEVTIGKSTKTNPTRSKPDSQVKNLSSLGVPMIRSKSLPELEQPDWATPGTRPEDSIDGMKNQIEPH